MINDLYTVFTIALASVLFSFGLLFYSLCRNAETPVYKTALRMMTFAYCFFGLVNVLEMWSRSSYPNNDDVLLFQAVTLIIAVSQAFLFTYTLILLIHTAYVTRKRVVCELVVLSTLSAALVVIYYILSATWIKLSVYIFILFYICLLIRYTRLFVITYRNCLQKMDNFFSGREADNLRWVKFSFYAALSIGLLALTASLAPTIHVGIFGSVIYLLFYLYFAIRMIKYGFFYKKIESALTDDDIQTEPSGDDKKTLPASIVENMERKLNIWLGEKQFLQSGITIEDVAAYIGTNRRYLSEHINSVKGKTFRQWISELRIEEAKNLMRQRPDMTLNDIALQVGYVDKSNLIRQFSRQTNLSPTQWKQKTSET
ncbi:MAG: AraC family transcriptional regulator [Bacteroidales bacterium]|nr:AraC family transcriptional regulator [Bacteroidales bacterium]